MDHPSLVEGVRSVERLPSLEKEGVPAAFRNHLFERRSRCRGPESAVMIGVEVINHCIAFRLEREDPMGAHLVSGPCDEARTVRVARFHEVRPVLNHLF